MKQSDFFLQTAMILDEKIPTQRRAKIILMAMGKALEITPVITFEQTNIDPVEQETRLKALAGI